MAALSDRSDAEGPGKYYTHLGFVSQLRSYEAREFTAFIVNRPALGPKGESTALLKFAFL